MPNIADSQARFMDIQASPEGLRYALNWFTDHYHLPLFIVENGLGVRRIEAITGEAVEKLIYMHEYVISSAKELFNNTPDLLKAIQHAVKENKELQKRVEDFSREKMIEIGRASCRERV